jgi:hypothetical protein
MAYIRHCGSRGDRRGTFRRHRRDRAPPLKNDFRSIKPEEAQIKRPLTRSRVLREKERELTELRHRCERLSAREREVMNLVATGMLNKQVAAELGASEATVKMYRSQVMKKCRPNPCPSSSGWRTNSSPHNPLSPACRHRIADPSMHRFINPSKVAVYPD